MHAVVGLHSGFEIREMIVDSRIDRHEDLRRGCPKQHETRAAFFCLEAADVGTQSLHHLPTGQTRLQMIARKSLGVVGIEGGGHGHDLLEF